MIWPVYVRSRTRRGITWVNTEGSPTPAKPKIEGADNVTINQGVGIDLSEGVSAVDGQGNPIEFTVEPEEIDGCSVGKHNVVYTATADGETTSVVRVVTIEAIDPPTISGLTDLTVNVGEEFDELDGVSAVDGNGNDVAVTVEQIDPPSPYPYTLCTMGAAQMPHIENGDTYTISPNIVWVTEPPHDNIHREIRVYGENVTYGGNTLSNPVGDGSLYYADDHFYIDFYINYAFEGIDYGAETIGATAYGDGMQALSWDSLRLEVIGGE